MFPQKIGFKSIFINSLAASIISGILLVVSLKVLKLDVSVSMAFLRGLWILLPVWLGFLTKSLMAATETQSKEKIYLAITSLLITPVLYFAAFFFAVWVSIVVAFR